MNNRSVKERWICFAGQTLCLTYTHPSISELIDFLFQDIPNTSQQYPTKTFDIVYKGGDEYHLLCAEEQARKTLKSKIAFAQTLYTETIYHLLFHLSHGVAIHAAALVKGEKSILIPGPTGAGKSTLAAWLTIRGWQYQTDELVFLPSREARMEAFTRPVCLKSSSIPVISSFISSETTEQSLVGPEGMVIPHRLLNNDFMKVPLVPNVILIPDFQKDSDLVLAPISRAQAGMQLMGCHVNARNLNGHGFDQIVSLIRKTRNFRLTYSQFDGLEDLLEDRLWT